MTTRYYRITKPAVLASWAAYKADALAVSEAGKAFASMFPGARSVCKTGLHGRRFSGLAFDPAMPSDVWTVPDRVCGDVQRPRKALRNPLGDRVARKAEHDRVVALYAEHEPRKEATSDAFYESMGTDWSTIMWSGFQIRECADALYVSIGDSLEGDGIEEVTGSAYLAERLVTA